MIKLGVNSVLFGGYDFRHRREAHQGRGLRRRRDVGHQGHVRAPRSRQLAAQADDIRRSPPTTAWRCSRMEEAALDEDRLDEGLRGRRGASASRSSTSAPAARATSRRTSCARPTCMAQHGREGGGVRRDALLQGARRRGDLQHADHAAGDGEDHLAGLRHRHGPEPHLPRRREPGARRCRRCSRRVRHIHIRDCKGRGPAARATPPTRPAAAATSTWSAYCQGHGRRRLRRPGLPGGHRRAARLDLRERRDHRRRELRLPERLPQGDRRQVTKGVPWPVNPISFCSP